MCDNRCIIGLKQLSNLFCTGKCKIDSHRRCLRCAAEDMPSDSQYRNCQHFYSKNKLDLRDYHDKKGIFVCTMILAIGSRHVEDNTERF